MAELTQSNKDARANEFRRQLLEFEPAYEAMEDPITEYNNNPTKAIFLSHNKSNETSLFLLSNGTLKERDRDYRLKPIEDIDAVNRYNIDECIKNLTDRLIKANDYEAKKLAELREAINNNPMPNIDMSIFKKKQS